MQDSSDIQIARTVILDSKKWVTRPKGGPITDKIRDLWQALEKFGGYGIGRTIETEIALLTGFDVSRTEFRTFIPVAEAGEYTPYEPEVIIKQFANLAAKAGVRDPYAVFGSSPSYYPKLGRTCVSVVVMGKDNMEKMRQYALN